MTSHLFIQNRTRQKLPKIDFDKIKAEVLGGNFELSLVFIGNTASRSLNRIHRGKDKSTNVLSFPLSKTSGEIFIDLARARQEQKKFGMTYQKFVSYLFIHGCLHLKGMSHGAKMDSEEVRLLSKFDKILNGSSNRSRN